MCCQSARLWRPASFQHFLAVRAHKCAAFCHALGRGLRPRAPGWNKLLGAVPLDFLPASAFALSALAVLAQGAFHFHNGTTHGFIPCLGINMC